MAGTCDGTAKKGGHGVGQVRTSELTRCRSLGSYVVRIEDIGITRVALVDDAALAHGRFGEETPRGHFDSPTYPFAYLVTDEAVWRAEGSHREEPPDPRSAGTLLQCFDG